MLFEEKHSKTNYYTLLEYDDILCIPHCQSSFEILFVDRGEVDAVFSDKKIRISEGGCVFVFPYEIHHYETPENSRVFVFIFSGDFLFDFAQCVNGKTLENPIVQFEKNDIEAIKSGDVFAKKSALYKLCSEVLKNGTKNNSGGADNDTAAKIMIFIQEHFREQITLEDIAEHLGYSYSYTSNIIKKSFGKSVCELLNEHRLNYAKKLLGENAHSITEIAELSGFSTIRNFNAVFKKAYNASPSQYQNVRTKNGRYRIVSEYPSEVYRGAFYSAHLRRRLLWRFHSTSI